MGEYTVKLARRIKENGSGGEDSSLLCAEYVSASAIRIGGQMFSHNVFHNPECHAQTGDNVLAARIGGAFYVICRVV